MPWEITDDYYEDDTYERYGFPNKDDPQESEE